MRKTQKRILGVFGLALVAAMTFAAIQLPNPEASATVPPVEDNIKVRIVGDVASAVFTKPVSGTLTNAPTQEIEVEYENASEVKLTLKHTDPHGVVTNHDIWVGNDLDYNAGVMGTDLDLSGYGYGIFYFGLSAKDVNGAELVTDNLVLEYMPTLGSFSGDKNTGDLIIDLDYDENKVSKVVVDIYVGGVKVETVTVENGEKRIIIPATTVDSWGDGDISFTITTYDKNGDWAYEYTYNFAEIPNTGTGGGNGAPDTGGLFQNLNISREDYLITGLLIFFVFAIVAFGVVMRGHKSKNNVKNRK